jgi:hypothetical protein
VLFAKQLAGGDPRSLGRTGEVVAEVLSSRDRLPELFDCLFADDVIVRMRAGDAVEKVARQQPEWLVPYLERLLDEVSILPQASVQWHVAQILGEVPLTDDQRRRAIGILTSNLESSTDWIVLTTTMEALTNLAAADEDLTQWLIPALRRRLADRRPAVAKRAAKQLARLGV